MMLTFTFTAIQNEQGVIEEMIWSGNISPNLVLQLVQQIVIQEAVRKAQEQAGQEKKEGGKIENDERD